MPNAIDISKWDSFKDDGTMIPIDWKETGFPLAIIKSSEALYEDPAFKMQWAAAKGLCRMAYHFFRSNFNAIAQAEKMKSILAADFNKDTDFVCIDFETRDGGMAGTECLRAALSFQYEMEKLKLPFIYTGPSKWFELGTDAETMRLKAAAKKYPLWLAQWPWDNYFLDIKLPPYVWTQTQMADKQAKIDNGAIRPVPCYPWNNDIAIWQWTAKANPTLIAGYHSNKKQVDYNKIYMTLPSIGTTPPAPVLTDHERIDRLEAQALAHGWNL